MTLQVLHLLERRAVELGELTELEPARFAEPSFARADLLPHGPDLLPHGLDLLLYNAAQGFFIHGVSESTPSRKARRGVGVGSRSSDEHAELRAERVGPWKMERPSGRLALLAGAIGVLPQRLHARAAPGGEPRIRAGEDVIDPDDDVNLDEARQAISPQTEGGLLALLAVPSVA